MSHVGNDHASYYANLKEHLGAKTAQDLLEELDCILEASEENETEPDPDLVAAYADLIRELEAAPSDSNFNAFVREHREAHAQFISELEPVNDNSNSDSQTIPYSHRIVRFRLMGILAAVLAVFLALMITAYGEQMWNAATKSMGELLHVGPGASGQLELAEAGENGYVSLQDALDDYGITGVAPTWIPTEMKIDGVEVNSSNNIDNFLVAYSSEEHFLVIQIARYNYLPDIGYEQNEGTDVPYRSGGFNHSIVKNYDQLRVFWEYGDCYCSITSDISEDELKLIIDSIYKD